MLSIKSVNALSHYTDWTIAHVHSGALGWNGFMAAGMMLPGMVSGYIQEHLGYQHFFIYVLLMTIPAFLMASLIKIDPEYGKK